MMVDAMSYRPKAPDRWGDLNMNGWEPVPILHWRRLFGYRMRRLVWERYSLGGDDDGWYVYATFEKCAQIILEETYGQPSR